MPAWRAADRPGLPSAIRPHHLQWFYAPISPGKPEVSRRTARIGLRLRGAAQASPRHLSSKESGAEDRGTGVDWISAPCCYVPASRTALCRSFSYAIELQVAVLAGFSTHLSVSRNSRRHPSASEGSIAAGRWVQGLQALSEGYG
jgi:hypothetical protein